MNRPSHWPVALAALFIVVASGCPRDRPAAPRREPSAAEIPADASLRLVTDPLPAFDPNADGATPPSIPLGPR
ncbi:MAG: hypothetical protein WCJ30_08590 [Deltaproteobacteria bacterium]